MANLGSQAVFLCSLPGVVIVLPSVCGSLCSRPETYLKWLKKFVNVDWWMWWYVFHSASVPTDLMLCWVLREYKSCNSLRKTD